MGQAWQDRYALEFQIRALGGAYVFVVVQIQLPRPDDPCGRPIGHGVTPAGGVGGLEQRAVRFVSKIDAKGFAVASILFKLIAHVVHEPFHGVHRHLACSAFITRAFALDAHIPSRLGPVAELVVFQLIRLDHQTWLSQQGVAFHDRLCSAAPADPVGLQQRGFYFLRLCPDQGREKKHTLGQVQGDPGWAAGRDGRYQGGIGGGKVDGLSMRLSKTAPYGSQPVT